MLPVKLDFQDANGLLNDRQHRIKSPHGPCRLTRWLTRLGLLRLVIRLVILWSIVRLGNLQSSLQRRLLILSLLKWRLLLNGNIERFRSLFLLSTWRCIEEFLQHFLSLIQTQVARWLGLLVHLLLLFVIKVTVATRDCGRRFVGLHRRCNSSGLRGAYGWSKCALFLCLFKLNLIRIFVNPVMLAQILIHGAISKAFLGFLRHFYWFRV